MSELVDVIGNYGVTGVLVILVAVFAFVKECVEGFSWVKDKLDAWYNGENEKQEKMKTVEERLQELEEKSDNDYKLIKELCQSVSEIKSSVNNLADEFRKDREDREKEKLERWIDSSRHKLIDVGSRIASNSSSISDDLFEEAFRLYDQYETCLTKLGRTNGQINITMKIIEEAWKERQQKGE